MYGGITAAGPLGNFGVASMPGTKGAGAAAKVNWSQAAEGVGIMAGTMMLQSSYHSGNVGMGVAGGAILGAASAAMAGTMFGAKIGMFAGPMGMAIGAAIGATVGLVVGLLGGGEAAREKERQRRLNVQAAFMFTEATPLGMAEAYGMGQVTVETDFTGRVRAYQGNTAINASLRALIDREVSRAILENRQGAADAVQFAAG
jgi:hypothetical protein